MSAKCRKPRLIDTILDALIDNILDDLGEAIASVEGDIDYLAEALERTGFPLDDALRTKFKARHTALVRARDWLVRYSDAERATRSEVRTDLFAPPPSPLAPRQARHAQS